MKDFKPIILHFILSSSQLWQLFDVLNLNMRFIRFHFIVVGEAIVEFEYIAQEEDELNLKVGDVITNITKTSEGWCEGSLNGRRGMFPDNFVKVSLSSLSFM